MGTTQRKCHKSLEVTGAMLLTPDQSKLPRAWLFSPLVAAKKHRCLKKVLNDQEVYSRGGLSPARQADLQTELVVSASAPLPGSSEASQWWVQAGGRCSHLLWPGGPTVL